MLDLRCVFYVSNCGYRREIFLQVSHPQELVAKGAVLKRISESR